MIIDCGLTANYLKEKYRMCSGSYGGYGDCINCPLHKLNNGASMSCYILEREEIDKAIEIVQRWSDEHPIDERSEVTFADDIKKYFPNYRGSRVFDPCVNTVYGDCVPGELCDKFSSCYDCWEQPIPLPVLKRLKEAREE